MIEIKSRWDGRVLFRAEDAVDIRQAVEEAARGDTDLRNANLRGADLRDADLRGANLRDANLEGANLWGANLWGANLRDANLEGANLRGANLRDANLWGANLWGANLRDANLRGANLRDANLEGANLWDADLRDDADWRSPLWATRQDMFSILDQAPAEVPALREAMLAGKIDGSAYVRDGCGCLCGTIGIAHAGSAKDGAVFGALKDLGIETNPSRPAEQWFVRIGLGDKPLDPDDDSIDWQEHGEGVFRITRALRWLDEWRESRAVIAKAVA